MASTAMEEGNASPSNPPKAAVALGGSFGAFFLCCSLYAIGWWMRQRARHERRRENYGSERGWHSLVSGRRLPSYNHPSAGIQRFKPSLLNGPTEAEVCYHIPQPPKCTHIEKRNSVSIEDSGCSSYRYRGSTRRKVNKKRRPDSKLLRSPPLTYLSQSGLVTRREVSSGPKIPGKRGGSLQRQIGPLTQRKMMIEREGQKRQRQIYEACWHAWAVRRAARQRRYAYLTQQKVLQSSKSYRKPEQGMWQRYHAEGRQRYPSDEVTSWLMPSHSIVQQNTGSSFNSSRGNTGVSAFLEDSRSRPQLLYANTLQELARMSPILEISSEESDHNGLTPKKKPLLLLPPETVQRASLPANRYAVLALPPEASSSQSGARRSKLSDVQLDLFSSCSPVTPGTITPEVVTSLGVSGESPKSTIIEGFETNSEAWFVPSSPAFFGPPPSVEQNGFNDISSFNMSSEERDHIHDQEISDRNSGNESVGQYSDFISPLEESDIEFRLQIPYT